MSVSPGIPPRTRGQIWLITLAAVGVVIVLNQFAGRPELSPMDFIVGGQDALRFCDPNHPRFYPSRASPQQPVTAIVAAPAETGGGARLVLRTASGKAIRRTDLELTEGRYLRLFVVDRSLTWLVAKEPFDVEAGVWLFTPPPPSAQAYRVYADFTPRATEREMYAWGNLTMPGAGVVDPGNAAAGLQPKSATLAAANGFACGWTSEPREVYARQPFALTATLRRVDGGPVLVQTIAGTAADLVAVDADLTGFAKFPLRHDTPGAGGRSASFRFRPEIRDPGDYVFWLVARVGGQTIYERHAATLLP